MAVKIIKCSKSDTVRCSCDVYFRVKLFSFTRSGGGAEADLLQAGSDAQRVFGREQQPQEAQGPRGICIICFSRVQEEMAIKTKLLWIKFDNLFFFCLS